MVRKSPRKCSQKMTRRDLVIRTLLTPVYWVLYPILLMSNTERGCVKPTRSNPVLYAFKKILSYPMNYIHKCKAKWQEKNKKPIHQHACHEFVEKKCIDIANLVINISLVASIFAISLVSYIIWEHNNIIDNNKDSYVEACVSTISSNISTTATTATTTTFTTTTTITALDDEDSSYKFTEDDIFLLASLVEQEMGSEDYAIPYLVDNNFNLYQSDLDYAQQCVAKSLINQMNGFGYDSIRETLTDSVQWGNSLDKFDYSGKSLASFNSRILRNVFKVITEDTEYIPDNLYYERCSEGEAEYTHDLYTAYNFMQENYSDEIDVYIFSQNLDGTWWMACTLPDA